MQQRYYEEVIKTVGHKTHNLEHGQAALIGVIFFLIIATAFAIGFTALAFQESATARRQLNAKQSYYLAEAGAEDVAYRLQTNKQVGALETLIIDGETVTTTLTTPSPGIKQILASGDVSLNIRKVRINLQTAPGASFNYGVQVGNGGLTMQNTSSVVGSVYSNGSITGNNSPTITGDAFAAGISIIDDIATINGNAHAYAISDGTVGKNASSTTALSNVTIGKHAHANTISGSTITENAYYQTSITSSTVGGTQYSGVLAPVSLPVLPMPITDAQIDGWQTAAAAGGIISSPCPYKPANGTFLGPIKITCDVEIDGTKIITITGPIWITGNLDIKNSAHMNLAASYAGNSEIIVVNDPANRLTSSKITVQNSAQINGSGTTGSYVLVISQNNSAESGGGETAIDIKNTSNAPVYYAPHGKIEIQNNTTLKEVTAYSLSIKNSAQVTYESGLANIYFSSGPSGGWDIDTWREVE